MAKKLDTDWEAIQREYRAGVLSVREIASMYDISHCTILKRAKKFPGQWVRDLSARVQAEVNRKLVTDSVTTEGDEESIVDAAAARTLAVIKKHRESIARTAEIEANIFRALDEQTNKPTGKKGKEEPAVSTKATTLLALVTAQERRIKLERQAYGVKEGPAEDGKITEIPIIFDAAVIK